MPMLIDGFQVGQVQSYSGTFSYLKTDGTSETVISTRFSPYTLTGADARELTVHFDISAIQGDASAPNVTVKVKEKIDGTNARTLDSLVVASSDSPGVVVGPIVTHRDIIITFQLSATLTSASQTVPYTIERKHL